MKESIYKNYDELPLFLNAKILAEVLGIAPSSESWQQIARREIEIQRVGRTECRRVKDEEKQLLSNAK